MESKGREEVLIGKDKTDHLKRMERNSFNSKTETEQR